MIQNTPIPVQIFIGLVLFFYVCFLHITIGKKRDASTLLTIFGCIALAGLLIHLNILCVVSKKYIQYQDLTTLLLSSVQFTLEMFLGKTIIYKLIGDAIVLPPTLFYIFVPIYWMAVLTSCFAIFHLISRWLHNRTWLLLHGAEASKGNTHIFIGCNSSSQRLAGDIHQNHPDHRIIFIDLPDEGDSFKGITILDIISRFFKDSKETEELNKYVVLKAGMGLKRLVHWLKNPNTKVYMLSDSQEVNMLIMDQLWMPSKTTDDSTAFKCKIYCHAKREGLINRYATLPDKENRINFIDSSFLAVEYLKKHNTGALLPVNYVDIAADPQTGGNLGYLNSGFNSAIIGFGETGKEAMKFLYEFGAFPNKDKDKAQFNCHIYDANINSVVGELGLNLESLHSSATTQQEFFTHECKIGSSTFWSLLGQNIKELNYIIICLGNDKLNLETALSIAEFAQIEGRSANQKLCIAVKMRELADLDKTTLANANAIFGDCIHVFGLLTDIWKLDVIDNESMNNDARKFFDSYTALASKLNETHNYSVENWSEREDKLRSTDYKERSKARRKIMQDYSNCLHKTTKQILCKGSNVNKETILPVNEGSTHCKGNDAATFEYLAICEHLRWEASHLALGYKPTDGPTDDVKKLHNCIKPYASLDDLVKHFDWLVVKNSL